MRVTGLTVNTTPSKLKIGGTRCRTSLIMISLRKKKTLGEKYAF